MIQKFGTVIVDSDRVMKIVENEKSSVKSVKTDNWIKLPKGSKNIGMMKPSMKFSKLSPEVIFLGFYEQFLNYFYYSFIKLIILIYYNIIYSYIYI